MPRTRCRNLLCLALAAVVTCAVATTSHATEPPSDRFESRDVFELEWASDPQISPDGKTVAYVRNGMDIMRDGRRSEIWRSPSAVHSKRSLPWS